MSKSTSDGENEKNYGKRLGSSCTEGPAGRPSWKGGRKENLSMFFLVGQKAVQGGALMKPSLITPKSLGILSVQVTFYVLVCSEHGEGERMSFTSYLIL